LPTQGEANHKSGIAGFRIAYQGGGGKSQIRKCYIKFGISFGERSRRRIIGVGIVDVDRDGSKSQILKPQQKVGILLANRFQDKGIQVLRFMHFLNRKEVGIFLANRFGFSCSHQCLSVHLANSNQRHRLSSVHLTVINAISDLSSVYVSVISVISSLFNAGEVLRWKRTKCTKSGSQDCVRNVRNPDHKTVSSSQHRSRLILWRSPRSVCNADSGLGPRSAGNADSRGSVYNAHHEPYPHHPRDTSEALSLSPKRHIISLIPITQETFNDWTPSNSADNSTW